MRRARGIEKRLGALPAIAHVNASYVSQTVTVTYDETRMHEDALRDLVRDCGFGCGAPLTAASRLQASAKAAHDERQPDRSAVAPSVSPEHPPAAYHHEHHEGAQSATRTTGATGAAPHAGHAAPPAEATAPAVAHQHEGEMEAAVVDHGAALPVGMLSEQGVAGAAPTDHGAHAAHGYQPRRFRR